MKKQISLYLRLGLLFYAGTLLLKQFFPVPEPVMGFLLGLSICFLLLGILPESKLNRIKFLKRSLFRHSK